MKGWVKTQWASLRKAFILTHCIREVKSVCQELLLRSVSWEKAHGCLRPIFFHPLGYSIVLKISPWENNSQIASVMGKKIARPSMYWLIHILLPIDWNRNYFITKVHFFKCTYLCRMKPRVRPSFFCVKLFASTLFLPSVNTGYQDSPIGNSTVL